MDGLVKPGAIFSTHRAEIDAPCGHHIKSKAYRHLAPVCIAPLAIYFIAYKNFPPMNGTSTASNMPLHRRAHSCRQILGIGTPV